MLFQHHHTRMTNFIAVWGGNTIMDTMHKLGKALVTNACPLNAHLMVPSEKLHCMTECAWEGGRIWSALFQKSSQHRGSGLESKQVDLPISANCPILKRATPAEQRPVWVSCMNRNTLLHDFRSTEQYVASYSTCLGSVAWDRSERQLQGEFMNKICAFQHACCAYILVACCNTT